MIIGAHGCRKMNDKDYGFVVVHIPHASTYIPEEYLQDYLVPEVVLENEKRRMTDSFCDELYDPVGFDNQVIATVSRLVCDVERFRHDADEPNARFGHGLMYTRTSYGRRLRENDAALRARILSEIYDIHHRRLDDAVDAALSNFGFCLIIDGHSFNSKKIVKFDNIFSLPDFDIGTDIYHTPEILTQMLYSKIESLGYTPRLNSPYAGAITPLKYYRQNKRVVSIMIETNRKLYMNEKTMLKSENFMKIREVCHSLMYALADTTLEYFRSIDG